MIYLDYAATTPCCPEVVEAMLPFFANKFANASSIDHSMGAEARNAVEDARSCVAELVGAKTEDVIFTSGSTEANNLVLSGTNRFVITSATEHPSVLDYVMKCRQDTSSVLAVSNQGKVDEACLRTQLEHCDAALVSIMHTNNETGAMNDLDHLFEAAKDNNALFHSDMSQAFLAAPIDFRKSKYDGISVSAHKLYGPKGVGALICNSRLRNEITPLSFGGGHERGLRSGTLNVPGIVGFGVAAALLKRRFFEINQHVTEMRKTFVGDLLRRFSGAVTINGGDSASPHVLSVTLQGVNNRALLRLASRELCFSLGSACATNKNEPSYVLRALGLSDQQCNETIRISFGAMTTLDDVMTASKLIASSANGLLEMVA
ncbi:MAG TPA: cysteine desulfurase family protein [Candidatus Rubrimentiphilum sp.]|nr:cysteine desulfurase family protein [Candidatus Rubrimentiphilum sp.]